MKLTWAAFELRTLRAGMIVVERSSDGSLIPQLTTLKATQLK